MSETSPMSLAQVLKELPLFTTEERQILLRGIAELEDRPLSKVEEVLTEVRLAEHKANRSSSVELDEMRRPLRRSTNR